MKLSKKKRKKLYHLLDVWTRCEIIGRFGPMNCQMFDEAAFEKIRIEDRIRKLMYGSSDLVELGYRWGLPLRRSKQKAAKKQLAKNQKGAKHV